MKRLHAWFTLSLVALPLLIVGCGAGLGKIEVENVDAVIRQSEVAIDQARLANAESLATEIYQNAQSNLDQAKEMKSQKQGLDAIRLAYKSLALARSAEQIALHQSQETSANLVIDEQDSEISQLKSKIAELDQGLINAQRSAQRHENEKSRLQSEINSQRSDHENEKDQLRKQARKLEREFQTLRDRYDQTNNDWQKAIDQISDYETENYKLKRQLALAESMTDEARQTAEQARDQAVEQSRNYSSKIDQLKQKNTVRDQKALLAQKAREAREFAKRQKTWQKPRTGKTSLTSIQIENGKTVFTDWHISWLDKAIDRHLDHYAKSAGAEKIVTQSGKETRRFLDQRSLITNLKEMIRQNWTTIGKPKFEADGESVIATYRYNQIAKRSKHTGMPNLYDIWNREVWLSKTDGKWQIYREIWQIYEKVPRY